LGIALQVHVDGANTDHIARLGVVFELLAVDLIETVGLFAENHDGHVMQQRPAAGLELHRAGGSHSKQRAPALRLGKSKALSGLLDGDPQGSGQNMLHRARLPARVQVKTGHHGHQEDGSSGEPVAEAGNGNRHHVLSSWLRGWLAPWLITGQASLSQC